MTLFLAAPRHGLTRRLSGDFLSSVYIRELIKAQDVEKKKKLQRLLACVVPKIPKKSLMIVGRCYSPPGDYSPRHLLRFPRKPHKLRSWGLPGAQGVEPLMLPELPKAASREEPPCAIIPGWCPRLTSLQAQKERVKPWRCAFGNNFQGQDGHVRASV